MARVCSRDQAAISVTRDRSAVRARFLPRQWGQRHTTSQQDDTETRFSSAWPCCSHRRACADTARRTPASEAPRRRPHGIQPGRCSPKGSGWHPQAAWVGQWGLPVTVCPRASTSQPDSGPVPPKAPLCTSPSPASLYLLAPPQQLPCPKTWCGRPPAGLTAP